MGLLEQGGYTTVTLFSRKYCGQWK